jgi:hypothetical protein
MAFINAPETVSHHTKTLRNNPVMDSTVDIREAVVTRAGHTQAFRRQAKALNRNINEGLTITLRIS